MPTRIAALGPREENMMDKHQQKQGPVWVEVTPEESRRDDMERRRKLIEKCQDGPLQGSHSEVLMVAFALGRFDEVPESWQRDPWAAWFLRLDDGQREAVQDWRKSERP